MINLGVKGRDGNIVHFRIKKNAGLNELMEKYYMSQSVKEAEQSQMFFVFEGRSLRKMQTADELKMQDGDVIESRCGACFKSQLCASLLIERVALSPVTLSRASTSTHLVC